MSNRSLQLWAPAMMAAVLLTPTILAAQTGTMRQWQYTPTADGAGCELAMRQVQTPAPAPGEVQVRMRAASLNGRDRGRLDGPCPAVAGSASIPLSDGAGEVIGVGAGVTRFQVGDRVVGTFFAGTWIDGDRPEGVMPFRRGGPGDGVLSEVIVGSAEGFVTIPAHLSYEEASTLTTAGVTAFVGLFKYGGLLPGDFVLLEGTGGVSSFGLLFAVAAGARPIITSSSDAKLARATELGAFGTVNYRRNPEWHEEVLRLTNGQGVKHVLEIGGRSTLPLALQTLGIGAHISLIGGLTGFGGSIPFGVLFDKDASATGFHVGSRNDFEEMNRFISGHRIRPIVDRVFEFDDAPEAFDFYLNGDFMGKVVIRL
ncbi:MAG: NAD(P)-dependent alcohol dehydrogenase [Gemmatimonadota bacterium]|nr:NAD(P)-dependent alcohol dehydrogenase [Gemmatimonadota bacterium]MDH3422241.1 NAD(P)-dependent alcohol dehydrogenase [Gemmatimonadota bacterium]